MKKLILFVAILAGFVSSVIAQPPPTSFTIDNRTGCTMYYELWGKPAIYANCNNPWIFSSAVIAIPPGPPVTYADVTAVPIGGLTAGDNFVKADIYFEDPNNGCAITYVGEVGESCGSYPMSQMFTPCGCATVTATWDMATSTLIFQ